MAGSRKLIVLFCAAVALLACAPGAAEARPPKLVSAKQSGGHIKVAWSLPEGVYAATVEISHSPLTDSDGFFTYDDYFGEPDTGDEQFTTPEQFQPGSYWVHVGGLDLGSRPDSDCDDCGDIEFTATAQVTVPAPGQGSVADRPASAPLTKLPVIHEKNRCKRSHRKRCQKKRRAHVKARTALEPRR